jgi:hypothetical protein
VDARWIPAANLHITLWFIGEVEDHRSEDLLRILNRPFDEPAFDIDVSGLGMFPPSGAPRVIWLGVRSGGESPARMPSELAVSLVVRLRAERRRILHLTIAREDVSRAIGYPPFGNGENGPAAGRCHGRITVFRAVSRPRNPLRPSCGCHYSRTHHASGFVRLPCGIGTFAPSGAARGYRCPCGRQRQRWRGSSHDGRVARSRGHAPRRCKGSIGGSRSQPRGRRASIAALTGAVSSAISIPCG